MQLPSEFKCAGNTIKVELVEKTNDNNYGNWCDATIAIVRHKYMPTFCVNISNLLLRMMNLHNE